jgi:hypothetical protein
LKHKLLNYNPKNCRNLKADAIPTLKLPGRNCCVNKDTANRFHKRSLKMEASSIVKTLCEKTAVSVTEENEVLPKINENDSTEEVTIDLQNQSRIDK